MGVRYDTKPGSTLDDKPWYIKVLVWVLTLLVCVAIAIAVYGIFVGVL